MARQYLSTIFGKAIQKVSRLRGGGGSALPGLVIEKIDPQFISRSLKQLPLGVVIISGTNGKTTTTKIVVELLESTGLKVFTNKTGSNFSRGVAAAILSEVDLSGKLNADIAVLELDEAWAVKFVELIQPSFCLLLNVMRDQLDRFGEIDTTAKLLEKIATKTTKGVVLNRDDPRIYQIAKKINIPVTFFGTTDKLLELMPVDDDLKNNDKSQANITVNADVLLENINQRQASFTIDGQPLTASLSLSGTYNILNAAAALGLVRQIFKTAGNSFTNQQLITALESVQPAFGRGEVIRYGESEIELILVKNPSGFRLALMSFADKTAPTMIAVNDNYADGRDMSWLWDIDFSALPSVAIVSGHRADDMALRLSYDEVAVGEIEPDLIAALMKLIDQNPRQNLRIFTSYTAMLTLRKQLSKLTEVEEIR